MKKQQTENTREYDDWGPYKNQNDDFDYDPDLTWQKMEPFLVNLNKANRRKRRTRNILGALVLLLLLTGSIAFYYRPGSIPADKPTDMANKTNPASNPAKIMETPGSGDSAATNTGVRVLNGTANLTPPDRKPAYKKTAVEPVIIKKNKGLGTDSVVSLASPGQNLAQTKKEEAASPTVINTAGTEPALAKKKLGLIHINDLPIIQKIEPFRINGNLMSTFCFGYTREL